MKEELIVRYIIGETDSTERHMVEHWITESDENKLFYDEIKRIWNIEKNEDHIPEIDVNIAWSKFTHIRDQNTSIQLDTKHKSYTRWISIAASILLLTTVSFWILQSVLKTERIVTSGTQKIVHTALPDGSTVHLNNQAKIVYEQKWLGKYRKVNLFKGEVFFNVKKDDQHPFVIESGKSTITVLGTSFHIRREENETELIVASGLVKIKHLDQELVLTPNQMVIVSDTLKQKIKVDTVPDQLYRYYVHQEFIFENTPLSRVFEILGKAYNIKFIIENPNTQILNYTATFEQQSISQILRVIKKTFDLKISKKDNAYYIN